VLLVYEPLRHGIIISSPGHLIFILANFIRITLLSVLAILLATIYPKLGAQLSSIPSRLRTTLRTMSTTNTTATAGALPRDPSAWRAALADLPSSTPNGIPAFYFAHGSPALAMPADQSHPRLGKALNAMGPKGHLAQFLADFGPALLEKYQPKGIVVFSAHWDEHGPRQGEFDR
jgi:hypothetical protein